MWTKCNVHFVDFFRTQGIAGQLMQDNSVHQKGAKADELRGGILENNGGYL